MTETMDPKSSVLDDVIKIQASDENPVPLIGYPREGTVADFELFTAKDLDILVERAAKYYSKLPVDPVNDPIVSLVGPSDLDYLITKFSLSRLGFGTLLLSTRLTPEACLKLLRENQCRTIIQSPSRLSFDLGPRTRELDVSIFVSPIASSAVYRNATWDSHTLVRPTFGPGTASQRTAIVYHSSGSTGLPKSIATSHEKLLSPIPTGKGSKALTSSPLCHAFASKLTINSMMVGKCMYLTNADMPSTAGSLVEVCRAVRPHVFLTVPYILKLLAETTEGVSELTKCKQVVSSGSQLSDDLGNRLVREGVIVETLFAGTEPGMVGSSMNRSPGDNAWDYIRLVPAVQQNVQYKPLGNNTFEFVYLRTLPTLNMSNSNDPPGSFHSSDILTPHPTIPHAWKYIGRIDDRVTLSTGEKVLPLPMEGRVRQEALVREAVVFGINRAIPGLLVFRSDTAKDLSDDDFITAIWPAIVEANSAAEAFGKIDRDMVVCLPAGAHIPAADKESIIRAKVYKLYEQQIQVAYEKMEVGSAGGLVLNLPELENHILELLRTQLGLAIPDMEADFHQAGMDSLQSIRLRSMIMKTVAVGNGKRFSQNAVFESGNVRRLAQKINNSQEDERFGKGDVKNVELMERMIGRYATFNRPDENTERNGSVALESGQCFLLTGATGSLGAHLLSQLLSIPEVTEVICIVRGSNPKSRLLNALSSRKLPHPNTSKITITTGDLANSEFSLPEPIKDRITHVIHAAWPVNFSLNLQAFEPQLLNLRKLLQLSISSRRPVKFFFCSSVSVALNTPPPAVIPETRVEGLEQAQGTGYASSKLVGERIVEGAVSVGADAYVLRIGQVVGDTEEGIWSDTEAWPLIIRAALTLGTLPALDTTCSWLPVNTLASKIIDLCLSTSTPSLPRFLNLENPSRFHWTQDLLPTLRETNLLTFETVDPKQWLQQLSNYQAENSDEGVEKNPAVKLLGYFEDLVCGLEDRDGSVEVVFETVSARKCGGGGGVDSFAVDVLSSGLVERFLEVWLRTWK